MIISTLGSLYGLDMGLAVASAARWNDALAPVAAWTKIPAKHLRDGETPPPRDRTKARIGRYGEDTLRGPDQADLRGLVNKAIEFAHTSSTSPAAPAATPGSRQTRRFCWRASCAASNRTSNRSPIHGTGLTMSRTIAARCREDPGTR